MVLLDLQASRPDVIDRVTREVPAGVSGEQWIHGSLHPTHRPDRASRVVKDQQPAFRSQDPFDLARRPVLIGYGRENEDRDDRVDSAIWKFRILGIADAQVDNSPELKRELFCDLEH